MGRLFTRNGKRIFSHCISFWAKDIRRSRCANRVDKLYKKSIQWQGPEVKNIKFKQNKVLVEYIFAETLKTSDNKPLRAFEVAGEGEKYKPAETKITGNTIEIWSDEVQNPKHFRYGYKAFTHANLVNGAGLPASTYSTEFEEDFKTKD